VVTVPDEAETKVNSMNTRGQRRELGSRLRTMVCPALGLVRNKDGVGQRRGGVGEAGGEDDAHVGP
jgi:hypothetical protein